MLHLEAVHAYYGDSHVLQGVSLSVRQGEIVCLLGRNGAGKSTTMKAAVGVVPPRSGSVRFLGEEIAGKPVYTIVRKGLAFVPEDRRIFAGLTVTENLEVALLPPRPGLDPWTIDRLFQVFPLLDRLRERKGGNLSGGEQQMLAIARALAGNPALLLLDEPCEGLAPVIVEELARVILEIKNTIPVLLAEQNALFALSISDRGYVIDKGLIRYEGTRHELLANTEIQSRYLSV
ncbi:ABC transporter ATP-binding protein [Desulfatirhabdium butyrativorans]|uniref:ABC transporter ATP-binding protein n=1 Tax=Desulfatirhabdium butyrativorans TaxID=340467 RepID=UPI00048729CD|nr:ABC transporter ATP-binding protein [Desulfatirhabdium butyrativorans]